MKTLHPTTQYKKDYKRFRNNPVKIQKLMVVLKMLQAEIPLPPEYSPHMLTGSRIYGMPHRGGFSFDLV